MRKIFTLQFFINFLNPGQTFKNQAEISETVNEAEFDAPGYCIENIMNFARSYRVAVTKSTGKIEMILN